MVLFACGDRETLQFDRESYPAITADQIETRGQRSLARYWNIVDLQSVNPQPGLVFAAQHVGAAIDGLKPTCNVLAFRAESP